MHRTVRALAFALGVAWALPLSLLAGVADGVQRIADGEVGGQGAHQEAQRSQNQELFKQVQPVQK